MKLRENLAHTRRQFALNVIDVAVGIGAPSAEKQAVVAGEAEIIEHPVGIADREIVRQQFVSELVAKRLGSDDIGFRRQHQPVQFVFFKQVIGVAREDHMLCSYASIFRLHGGRGAMIDRCDVRSLENFDTVFLRCGSLTQEEVERMAMGAAPIDQAANIGVGGGVAPEMRPVHKLQNVASAMLDAVGVFFFQRLHLFGVERHRRCAMGVVAFDVVFLEARLDNLIAEIASVPQEFFGLRAELVDEFAFARPAGEHLPAITARCAPSDAVRL